MGESWRGIVLIPTRGGAGQGRATEGERRRCTYDDDDDDDDTKLIRSGSKQLFDCVDGFLF